MAGLREALKGDDAVAILAKSNEVAQASLKLSEAISGGTRPGSGGSDGASAAGKDNVVDADFTEVDDETGRKKSA
jgi:molecular chaperone DnaK